MIEGLFIRNLLDTLFLNVQELTFLLKHMSGLLFKKNIALAYINFNSDTFTSDKVMAYFSVHTL